MTLSSSPCYSGLDEGLTSLLFTLLVTMTTTKPKLQPKPVRKATSSEVTPVTPSQPVVITKQRDFTHKEPVIIPSHLDEIPVISAASYIKDARNRWYIHTVEVKEVWDVHVNLFNNAKPHILKAHDYVVKRYQELTNDG